MVVAPPNALQKLNTFPSTEATNQYAKMVQNIFADDPVVSALIEWEVPEMMSQKVWKWITKEQLCRMKGTSSF